MAKLNCLRVSKRLRREYPAANPLNHTLSLQPEYKQGTGVQKARRLYVLIDLGLAQDRPAVPRMVSGTRFIRQHVVEIRIRYRYDT